MAGNEHGDGITVVGHAHGTKALGAVNGLGYLTVAAGLAVGNLLQGIPHLALKGRTRRGEGQIKFLAHASQIFFQLFKGPQQQGRCLICNICQRFVGCLAPQIKLHNMLAALHNAHGSDMRKLARQSKACLRCMRRVWRFSLLVIVHAYFPFLTVTGLSK